MTSVKHSIEATEGQVRLRLAGDLTPEDVKRAGEELAGQLSAKPARSFNLVVDLTGVEGCNVAARSELATLQREVGPKARRTAYIASRSRFRGLALWVIHLADDGNAKSVMSEEAIKSWFGSDSHRVEQVRHQTMALVGKLQKGGA